MESFLPILTALWLGILCSISPCPLATNIAAISYVSYRVANQRMVVLSGVLYTLGRSAVYAVLGFLTLKTLVNMPLLSNILQQYINKVIGFFLIAIGLVLLDIWSLRLSGISPPESLQKRLGSGGLIHSFLLGGLFALALCPVSAAMFFGGLIPLSIRAESMIGLPLIFGIGTGMPVMAFALIVATGARYLDKVYKHMTRIELFARRGTGIVFILVGSYYILAYNFGLI
ncbi:MAG: aromatic aminobenezylarsenical efflux permease ArsG family transporter [Syntrophales bacterium]